MTPNVRAELQLFDLTLVGGLGAIHGERSYLSLCAHDYLRQTSTNNDDLPTFSGQDAALNEVALAFGLAP